MDTLQATIRGVTAPVSAPGGPRHVIEVLAGHDPRAYRLEHESASLDMPAMAPAPCDWKSHRRPPTTRARQPNPLGAPTTVAGRLEHTAG
jgi:hypothetical protein